MLLHPVEEAIQHPDSAYLKETLNGKVVANMEPWASVVTSPLRW